MMMKALYLLTLLVSVNTGYANAQMGVKEDSLITYSIEKDGPFLMNGHELWLERTVIQKEATEESAFCRAVSEFRILDTMETEYYKKEVPFHLNWSPGIDCESVIKPFMVDYSAGQLLVIEYWSEPDAGNSTAFQFFGWDADAIRPYSNIISGLSVGWLSAYEEDQQSLLPEDKMEVAEWGYYYVLNYTLQLQATENGYRFYPITEAYDDGSGLSLFEVSDFSESEIGGGDEKIFLYESLELDAGEELSISKDTKIEYGKAYGEISFVGELGYRIKIKCLEVNISGQKGYVKERDYYEIGLRAAG